MLNRIHSLVMVVIALVVVSAFVQAEHAADDGRLPQARRGESTDEHSRNTAGTHAARERWNAMSAKERKLMRERFDKLQKLPHEEREAMRERADRFARLRTRTWEGLSRGERERIDQLPAEKRDAVLQEMMVAEARRIGERILDKLPAETRTRLENARPEDRIHFLQEFKRKQLKRVDGLMHDLGKRLGVERDEVRAARDLEGEERKQRVLGWMKDHATRQFETGTADPDFPTSNLRRLSALEPEEFFEALLRLRDEYPGVAGPLGVGQPDAGGARGHELRRLMQSSVDEHVELADLDPKARKQELSNRRRTRVVTYLREQGELSTSELGDLNSAPDSVFFRRVRELISASPKADRSGRKGQRSPRAQGRSGADKSPRE